MHLIGGGESIKITVGGGCIKYFDLEGNSGQTRWESRLVDSHSGPKDRGNLPEIVTPFSIKGIHTIFRLFVAPALD